MNKGLLNKVVKIYNVVVTLNQYGEQVESYQLLTETKAQIIKRRGSASEIAGQVEYIYPIEFRVGYYLDIRNFAIVEYEGNFYQADSVLKYDGYISIDTHLIDSNLVSIQQ